MKWEWKETNEILIVIFLMNLAVSFRKPMTNLKVWLSSKERKSQIFVKVITLWYLLMVPTTYANEDSSDKDRKYK